MEKEFHPPRRLGLILQGGLILALSAVGGYFFYLATQDLSGLDFILHLLIALVVLIPLPLLGYRFYALLTAEYILRRDGLVIHWGLRREDIPLRNIEWIRPANELGFRLPLPWLRLPGAILGSRPVSELGQVEFMAVDLTHMLLVATPEKIFAISPTDVGQFAAVFQQINELGSLAPIEPQSIYPKIFIGHVWEDKLARSFIMASLGVGLVLLAVVGFALTQLEMIAWTGSGYDVPAERLLLLPVLEGFILLANLAIGLFIYRRGEDMRIAAYLLWGSAGFTGLFLLVGSLVLIF